MKGFGIILLAAGPSSRMGQSKQSMIFEGETLLERSIRIAKETDPEILVVVLGANEEPHRKLIKGPGIIVTLNKNWPGGIGSSIKCGLRQVMAIRPTLQSVLFMVCDQPFVTPSHLKMLRDTHSSQKEKIVASSFSKTAGVPVLFPKKYFDDILKLDDDSGAKAVIQHHKLNLLTIELPHGEVDIDTMEDYRKATGK